MTSTVVKLNWFGKNMATLSASRLYEAKHAESMGSGESPCFSTLRRWFRGNRILNYVNDVPGWTRPFKFKGLIPQAESGSRGTRADQGVRPISVNLRIDICRGAHVCWRHGDNR